MTVTTAIHVNRDTATEINVYPIEEGGRKTPFVTVLLGESDGLPPVTIFLRDTETAELLSCMLHEAGQRLAAEQVLAVADE